MTTVINLRTKYKSETGLDWEEEMWDLDDTYLGKLPATSYVNWLEENLLSTNEKYQKLLNNYYHE